MASLLFKSPYTRQIALWTLRTFSSPETYKCITTDIAKFLGLPKDIDRSAVAKLSATLGGMLRELESNGKPTGLPSHVTDNTDRLARMCRLNATEQAILQYLVCCKTHPGTDRYKDCVALF